MQEREGIRVKVVAPQEKFMTADDVIAALTPRTRLVSISHVRFDDGSMLDVPRLAEACHKQGALLLLDVSQSCGAVPIDVATLGADFLVGAGYKWLLGPFGTGFFWIKKELLASVRPAPYYWMAVEGSDNFSKLDFSNPKPAASAKRWDAPEWGQPLQFQSRCARRLRRIRSPRKTGNRSRAQPRAYRLHVLPFADRPLRRRKSLDRKLRGPYGCFVARTPEKTAALYNKLREQKVFVSLRESKIRVSPYLYNTIQDIDRLIAAITT